MPGPLPQPQRRRRNAPTIPTTSLPAGGRKGPVPDPPEWVTLGVAGRAWWEWAWSTPQAAGWSERAHLDVVARRAALVDDLHAIEADSLAGLDEEALRALVSTLKALVSGKATLLGKVTELDDRLGLTPKSMAQLRWTIVDDGTVEEQSSKGSERTGNVVVPDRWRKAAGAE